MAKWYCSSCDYVYTGFKPPQRCPICHATTFLNYKKTVKSTPSNDTNNKSYTKQEAMKSMPAHDTNNKSYSKQGTEMKQTTMSTQVNTQRNKPIIQGVSVVSTNVVSEQDIARAVQQEVNKEIDKLNAQGKRVINVSVGSAVKNVIGMKHHILILWEKA